MIEKTFLVLAEAVIMLVIRRDERRAHLIKLLITWPPIVLELRIAVFVIGDRLRPVGHFQQFLPTRCADGDVRGRR